MKYARPDSSNSILFPLYEMSKIKDYCLMAIEFLFRVTKKFWNWQ